MREEIGLVATQQLVDREVRWILEEAHEAVRNLPERERGKLDALAQAPLAEEPPDEAATRGAAGIERGAVPV